MICKRLSNSLKQLNDCIGNCTICLLWGYISIISYASSISIVFYNILFIEEKRIYQFNWHTSN